MTTRKAYTDPTLVDEYGGRHFGGAGGQYVVRKDCGIIADILAADPGMLLDVPCGTGVYSEEFKARGWRAVAADAALPMLRKAASERQGQLCVQCDANNLPFADATFDAIVTIRLFQHLTKLETTEILCELSRVLKPYGVLIFDTFGWTPRRLLRRKGEMHTYSPAAVRRMVAQAGLCVSQARASYLFSPLAYRRLPAAILRGLDFFERLLPDRWLLRTFWACTKRSTLRSEVHS